MSGSPRGRDIRAPIDRWVTAVSRGPRNPRRLMLYPRMPGVIAAPWLFRVYPRHPRPPKLLRVIRVSAAP